MSDQVEEQILRVGAGSNPQALASAIAHSIYDTHTCKMRAIGAGAVNQAVKAIAIARGFAAPRGFDLVCVPSWTSIDSKDGNGEKISAVVFVVRPV